MERWLITGSSLTHHVQQSLHAGSTWRERGRAWRGQRRPPYGNSSSPRPRSSLLGCFPAEHLKRMLFKFQEHPSLLGAHSERLTPVWKPFPGGPLAAEKRWPFGAFHRHGSAPQQPLRVADERRGSGRLANGLWSGRAGLQARLAWFLSQQPSPQSCLGKAGETGPGVVKKTLVRLPLTAAVQGQRGADVSGRCLGPALTVLTHLALLSQVPRLLR